ncbi:unnamed protein product [Ilex paraguariensis]|uniref:Uncharacterized protein n=1 Tax=Ilex paraguariensis TaxID=185542 RepID=A0ABC8S2Q1_9AQUA
MKERGKATESNNGNFFSDFNFSSSSDLPCKKHPSSSSVGICAYCLKDRLIKLVCSDCGEQRLSSCSCSDISSYRNSCSTVDVGSVGRISFLIENEKTETQHSHSKPKNGERSEAAFLLKRSSSSCVEIKRSNGIWSFGRIGRLFRKKREKGSERNGGFDDESDMGVSRSRSLCSYRVGGFNYPDQCSDFGLSSAKISDFTGGILLDAEKQVGLNEAEPRKSGFEGVLGVENGLDFKGVNRTGGPLELDRASSVPTRCVFPVKESDFSGMDESAFIDLKLDLSSESKSDFSGLKMSDLPISLSSFGSLRSGAFMENLESARSFGSLKEDLLFGNGPSCRITVNDRGFRKGSKGYNKVWKWIFRHHSGLRSASKKDENHTLRL